MMKKENNETGEEKVLQDRCPHDFEEKLLSGYLDEELTQATAQRVRVHLEDCATCGNLFAEMERIREVSMTTKFVEPKNEDWNEKPIGAGSKTARSAGWALLVTWITATAIYGAWEFITGPEKLFDKILVFAGVSGIVLLFVSVLLDRIRSYRTDRYKGVEK